MTYSKTTPRRVSFAIIRGALAHSLLAHSLLAHSIVCVAVCAGQDEEPRFYTSFGRAFIQEAEAIVVVRVDSAARIGITDKVLVEVEVTETVSGKAAAKKLHVIGALSNGLKKGDRAMLFLDLKPRSKRQYWSLGAVKVSERSYKDKRQLVEVYLRFAQDPAETRFARTLQHLEDQLSKGRTWARWNALRELADLSIRYPKRVELDRIRRWRTWIQKSRPMREAVDRLEKEWRKARAAKGGNA